MIRDRFGSNSYWIPIGIQQEAALVQGDVVWVTRAAGSCEVHSCDPILQCSHCSRDVLAWVHWRDSISCGISAHIENGNKSCCSLPVDFVPQSRLINTIRLVDTSREKPIINASNLYQQGGREGGGEPKQWIRVLQSRLGRERTFFQAQQKPHKGSTYHRRATLIHLTVSTQPLYVYMLTNLSSTKNPVPSAAPTTISVLGCECVFEWVYVRYISEWVHVPHMVGVAVHMYVKTWNSRTVSWWVHN